IISPQKNLLNLLKAFSTFKKRQKSGMQLVMTGNEGFNFEAFSTSLQTYKLRAQVKLLPHLGPEEKKEIFAGSYALIIPSGFDSCAENIFFAMQNSIPVLAAENTMAVELCGEAGIYFNSNDIKNMAEKMMFIFKDEDKRKELIEMGKKRFPLFNWDKSAEKFFHIIFQQYQSNENFL
ncbi:MAG: glycosyltransferase, partial [Ginsengibacter sp.]